jgi:hypothetical protein
MEEVCLLRHVAAADPAIIFFCAAKELGSRQENCEFFCELDNLCLIDFERMQRDVKLV